MFRRITADGFVVTLSSGHVYIGATSYTRGNPLTPKQRAIFSKIIELIDGDEICLAIGICRANLSLEETIRQVAKVS